MRVKRVGGINEVTRIDLNIRAFLALESSVLFNPLLFFTQRVYRPW